MRYKKTLTREQQRSRTSSSRPETSGRKFLYEQTGMVISPIHPICPACSTLRKDERRVWHLLTGVLPTVLDDVGGL